MKYIAVTVRTAMMMHGYTENDEEIIQVFKDQVFVEKLLLIDRIQSITEKYILVTSSHGRVMYWEYEGGFAALKLRLSTAGLVM